jgi:hypothetical protein
MRKIYLLVISSLLFSAAAYSQQTDLELELTLGGSIPLHPTLENGQELYQIGPAIQGGGFIPIRGAKGFYGAARVGFLNSTTHADKAFNLIALAPGIELRHQMERVVLSMGAYSGLYLGMFDGSSAMDLFVQAGPGLRFHLSPGVTLGLSADYTHCFADSFRRSLYSGIQVSLGSSYDLGAGKNSPILEYREIRLDPVFPVFHAYYDDHEMGGLELHNPGAADVHDLIVTFYAPEYMDRPKECISIERLAAGAAAEVPLYGLFNRTILGTTEGTKVPGEITVTYTYLGQQRSSSFRESLTIRNRNAMTWDDDRKAASFITARDEDILRFAKNTAAYIRDNPSRIVNRTFRIAMGMFRALERYGLQYVIDPATPYKELSASATSVDDLQFPAQTLSFGGGDCDDLSILYAALLEAVGIETAFITVPGHILLAFNAEVPPDDMPHIFINQSDVILRNGKCWVPVEVTMLNSSFLTAWREGARKWRQYESANEAGFLPVRSAWETFEPVDRPPLNTRVPGFEPAGMQQAYRSDLEQMIAFQIQDRIHELREKISAGGEHRTVYINKLGVLYARYGLLEHAEREFLRAEEKRYFPAVLNLGNLLYLRGEYEEALSRYQQALALRSGNSLALLGLARVQFELENYPAAETAYLEARRADPSAAARYSYLASSDSSAGSRAADSEAREEAMVWGY